MSERFKDITALRAIGLLHKTQINLKTYASRCAICKTPVPCNTQRLVLDGLAQQAQPTSITHDDWNLLEVGDLAPYSDPRFPGEPRKADARGREVLAELHEMLFGKVVGECGCDI